MTARVYVCFHLTLDAKIKYDKRNQIKIETEMWKVLLLHPLLSGSTENNNVMISFSTVLNSGLSIETACHPGSDRSIYSAI